MHWCAVKYDEQRDMAAYEEMVLLMDWRSPLHYDRLIHTKVPMPLARDSYISLATTDTTTPNMDLIKSPTPKAATPSSKVPAPGSDCNGKSETSRDDKPEIVTARSTAPHIDTPKTPQDSSTQQHTVRSDSQPRSAKPKTATPKTRFLEPMPRSPSPPAHRESNPENGGMVPGSSAGRISQHEATPTGDTMVMPVTTPTVPSVVSQGLLPNYRTSSQRYRATSGAIPTGHLRSYGVPTIRSDLAAPRLKRVSDNKVQEH